MTEIEDEFNMLQTQIAVAYEELKDAVIIDDYVLRQSVNYLLILWAEFHIYITTPFIEPINPPIVIPPEFHADVKKFEYVYDIVDHGYYLSTSRGAALVQGLRTMGKFYNTIEKMIKLLSERLQASGIPPEQEVHVAFQGLELAQRKAFESVLNLERHNVIVTNFRAGAWGDIFMKNIRRLAEKGYGVPKSAPRSVF